ncbi:MAG: hypothetical protein IPM07_15190 [Anaerolineales bacterium]|nr:hypothetical protein [Anaerolineales bacterium]
MEALHVCLEATGRYGVRWLITCTQGHQVSLVNRPDSRLWAQQVAAQQE